MRARGPPLSYLFQFYLCISHFISLKKLFWSLNLAKIKSKVRLGLVWVTIIHGYQLTYYTKVNNEKNRIGLSNEP